MSKNCQSEDPKSSNRQQALFGAQNRQNGDKSSNLAATILACILLLRGKIKKFYHSYNYSMNDFICLSIYMENINKSTQFCVCDFLNKETKTKFNVFVCVKVILFVLQKQYIKLLVNTFK